MELTILWWAIGISIVLAAASLIWAVRLRTAGVALEQRKTRSYLLLAFWVLVPPVWFFFEFQYLHPDIYPQNSFELSRVEHSQDLARNVWLAFVVVLAVALGVKWPPHE